MPEPRRLLVLIDGEHYPPVIEAALAELRERGDEISGLALLGGLEKLPAGGLNPGLLSEPVVTGATPAEALTRGIERFNPEVVVDLSDQPVLDPRLRMELAGRALAARVPYEGTDFTLAPPRRDRLAVRPSIAVVGTGKRTGKTSICGALARELVGLGHQPLIVAMGRGGPVEPEVIRPHRDGLLTAEALISLADDGRHAASDHIEDAVLAGVTSIGTRRCGGGLAGAPGPSTFTAGVEVAGIEAEEEGHDIFLFEGSGSAIPPVHSDATVLVLPASIRTEELVGYLGPYRLLLADCVVVVKSGESEEQVAEIEEAISGINEAAQIVSVVLEPVPTGDVRGKKVVVATTAPARAVMAIESHLKMSYGADIVGTTAALSNREQLSAELPPLLEGAEVVATELKAAGVDVVARAARDAGCEVVFIDNRPRVTGEPGTPDSPSTVAELARSLELLAEARFGT